MVVLGSSERIVRLLRTRASAFVRTKHGCADCLLRPRRQAEPIFGAAGVGGWTPTIEVTVADIHLNLLRPESGGGGGEAESAFRCAEAAATDTADGVADGCRTERWTGKKRGESTGIATVDEDSVEIHHGRPWIADGLDDQSGIVVLMNAGASSAEAACQAKQRSRKDGTHEHSIAHQAA